MADAGGRTMYLLSSIVVLVLGQSFVLAQSH